MKTVSLDQAGREELALPPRVQEALGELVGSAKEGLLALSVGVGLGVLEELMAEEVEDVCGPKGKHDPDRTAYRHGSDDGEVTLGGRRVAVERPRARSADGREEVRLRTYEYFADRDPLSRSVLERMLAGVSTRRYRRTQEPVGSPVEQAARSTSKSSVSRIFISYRRSDSRGYVGWLNQLISDRFPGVGISIGASRMLGLLFGLQILAGFLPGSWSQDISGYLPATAGQAVTFARPDPTSSLPPWTGFGVFCLYAAILLGLAAVRMRRGDA